MIILWRWLFSDFLGSLRPFLSCDRITLRFNPFSCRLRGLGLWTSNGAGSTRALQGIERSWPWVSPWFCSWQRWWVPWSSCLTRWRRFGTCWGLLRSCWPVCGREARRIFTSTMPRGSYGVHRWGWWCGFGIRGARFLVFRLFLISPREVPTSIGRNERHTLFLIYVFLANPLSRPTGPKSSPKAVLLFPSMCWIISGSSPSSCSCCFGKTPPSLLTVIGRGSTCS